MSETAALQPTPPHRCSERRKDGEACQGFATATGKCAGHSRLGAVANPVESAERSRAVRRKNADERHERRSKTLKDVYADRLEANAEKIVSRLERIVANGTDADALRAMEQWTSRVMGRPTERVEVDAAQPAALEELDGMTPEGRAALLASVGRGGRLRLVHDADVSQAPATDTGTA